MPKIYFSLHEANELVKKIKPELERIIQLTEELELLDNTKIILDEVSVENLMLEVELNKNFHEKNLELYSTLGLLIRKGCVIRDINDIELDFYFRFNDRDIFLCWTPHDNAVKHWHETGENKSKRKSVKLLERTNFEKLERLR